MKEEPVPGFGVFHQPLESVENASFRGPAIHQHPDVLYGKVEIFQQNVPDIGGVVDAALKIRAGELILVDTDKKGFVGHGDTSESVDKKGLAVMDDGRCSLHSIADLHRFYNRKLSVMSNVINMIQAAPSKTDLTLGI
jgi:hypothetical protein